MMRSIPHRAAVPTLLLVLLLVLCSFGFGAGVQRAGAQPDTTPRCFEETGHCISGRIRDYWEQNGGLPVFGFPISEQRPFTIEGQPIEAQWFERNRLELHPENNPPYDVLLGRLGVDVLEQQGRDWQQFPKEEPQDGCRFFTATQQNVCGDILTVWRANGLELGDPGISEAESLALFGLPISPLQEEAIDSETYQVQWFERARFELHPENEPPFNVLLGLLGNEVQQTAQPTATPDEPAATPTPTRTPATPDEPAATPTPTRTPTIPAPEPPAGRVVFTSGRDGNHEIYRINADGTGETRLTENDDWDGYPDWSPDGTRIAFSAGLYGGGDIYVMQADGSGRTRLYDSDQNDLSPEWSPDGTRIVFASGRGEDEADFDLYVMQADGSNVTRLTDSPHDETDPAWSPDGTRIAFVRGTEIYTINADGTGETRLTNNARYDEYPAWSPDGTRIAFTQSGEVTVMQADGSQQTRLTTRPEGEQPAWAPAWSPDGNAIAFTRNATISIIGVDGSNQHRLVGNGFAPDWTAPE